MGSKPSDAERFVMLINQKFEGQTPERRSMYVTRGDEMIGALAKTAFSLCRPQDNQVSIIRSIDQKVWAPAHNQWESLNGYRVEALEKSLHSVRGTVIFYPRNGAVWHRQRMYKRPAGSQGFLGSSANNAYVEDVLNARQIRELFVWMRALKPQS